jgi:hypothetical protein
MTLALLVVVKIATALLILSTGLGSTMADILYLWRRPQLLLRSILAMYFFVPLAAFFGRPRRKGTPQAITTNNTALLPDCNAFSLSSLSRAWSSKYGPPWEASRRISLHAAQTQLRLRRCRPPRRCHPRSSLGSYCPRPKFFGGYFVYVGPCSFISAVIEARKADLG